MTADPFAHRHTSVQHMGAMLRPNPNLKGVTAGVAQAYWGFAQLLLDEVPDGPELTEALRKLWESKNNAIMAIVLAA